ncbi:hypothetical protein MLD38_037395 [Melastoma candidum]|uniref:Uncharacterized protein n=1 Tax=Melastoma candidum TaxID=119954 RepID=A0ACB9LPD5_9MYRT|nr:hypothetical protein MLD38_037395 [Melastoma candidum]
MATPSLSWFCFVILLCSAAVEALEGGFSVELIHRDSPKSPFYDPFETPFQRVGKAVRRSIARVRGLRLNDEGEPSANITRIDGDYLINVTIGTPPVSIVAIADTASDLIWTQCLPCDDCFPQEAPLFNPRASSTYAEVDCNSDECHVVDRTNCSTRVFIHTSGIVGLSPGDASLVSQIGGNERTHFAYCLVPFFSTSKYTSKLTFGSDALLAGQGIVTTPLIIKSETLYYHVTLEGTSINGKKFEVSGSTEPDAEPGNMIIDSGTTLTWLPSNLYRQIEPAVSAAIDLPRAKDPISGYNLCYRSSGVLKGAPSITMHFTGADVALNWYNAFFELDENITCFSFVPTDGLPVYGNMAQTDFMISYDLTLDTLSFKPHDCAN